MIRDAGNHKSLTNHIIDIITITKVTNRHRVAPVATQPHCDNVRHIYIFDTKEAGFMCRANLSYSNSESFAKIAWLHHDIICVQQFLSFSLLPLDKLSLTQIAIIRTF